MANLLRDPAILICIGVILIGLVLLPIAIGKLFKKTSPDSMDGDYSDTSSSDSLFGASRADSLESSPVLESEPETRPESKPRFTPPVKAEPATPPVSKEITERLDEMSKRLSEMQSALHHQVSNPTSTPLTAETIDQLLKIIGNVTLQVDILQRSFGATLSSTGKPLETISPASVVSNPPPPAAKPAAASTPVSASTPSGPGSKGIGVAGGALSGTRPGAKPGTVAAPPASNTPEK